MKILQPILFTTELIFWLLVSVIISLLLLQYLTTLPQFPLQFKSLVVRSGSMEPTIMTGDMIFIRTSKQYGKDDVITFKDNHNIVVTHRIIDTTLTPEGQILFTTKGDNNQTEDVEPIAPDAIMGKWWFTIPWLGYLLVYARTPLGIIVFISLVLGLLASDITWDHLQKHRHNG